MDPESDNFLRKLAKAVMLAEKELGLLLPTGAASTSEAAGGGVFFVDTAGRGVACSGSTAPPIKGDERTASEAGIAQVVAQAAAHAVAQSKRFC